MGRISYTYADHDGERSVASFTTADLTDGNIAAEYAAAISMQAALEAILRGKLQKRAHVAKVSPQGVGAAADPEAQREEKALIRYYDNVTFEKGVVELPCIDMQLQNVDYPGVFYRPGATNNDADIEAFVTEFEALVTGPGGNTSVVEEIIHVGRAT
jgi:hypothetical protein